MALTVADFEAIAGHHRTRTASDVKAHWRRIVDEARDGEIVVTNHNRAEAVVMSAERYAKLQKAARANDPLHDLHERFDERLQKLQGPEGVRKLQEVFDATPQQLADAANKARHRK